jgi:hypothetical protein
MQILKKTGIDWGEIKLVSKLYGIGALKVGLEQGYVWSVKIWKGVRQKWCLPPILFKLYSEYLTKEAPE